jgi:methylthioribose-1-phosphate isomerase
VPTILSRIHHSSLETMLVKTSTGPRDIRAIWLEGGVVKAIDQRVLPGRFEIVDISTSEELAEAIRDMTIRGAPSIGAAAAYGMALAALNGENLEVAASLIKSTRPTAHDLFYAVDLMLSNRERLPGCADEYADSIVERCRAIGENGKQLITDGCKVMTHCNAGALATVDYGTALAPMRAAHRSGREFFVYVDETRPRLQGAKLTAWELLNEGIEHAIIADNASGHYLRTDVDIVIVGADRIARNGDFANKIGTYEKAVLARENDVPFYVAAPVSTFDQSLESGDAIIIEQRSPEEVLSIDGVRVAPQGSDAINPAFDVTPARYVTGFITEAGVFGPDMFSKLLGD